MSNAESLQSELFNEKVFVFDGPMGTELYRHHVFTNRCFEELNLSEPNLIREILSDYEKAGADCLTTNTFGANRPALEKYGLADKLTDICRRGAEIAKEIAVESERKIYIAGSIGPIPAISLFSEEQLEEMILQMVDPLIEGGADFIAFETIPSRKWMEICAQTMVKRPQTPFMLSVGIVGGGWDVGDGVGTAVPTTKDKSVDENSKVRQSLHPTPHIPHPTPHIPIIEKFFAPLPENCAQPIALGFNCGSGPDGLIEPIEQAMRLTNLPLIVQPNAGVPKEFEGRHLYYCSPEYAATYAIQFVNLGVRGVGGCCGMTPEHIKAIAQAIKPLSKGRAVKSVLQNVQPEVAEQPESEFAERSKLAWKLANKKWIQLVELVPPRGFDLTQTVEKSRKLHRHGIDAINIPDGPRASSRISPLVVAQRIQQGANIEAILHFCCRDRNLIGMQADLLACAASDIHNILFVTGDPPKLGLYPNATGVFDADSVAMCAVQRRLNRGVDLGGQQISPTTQAVIGVGLDPTALDQEREKERFRQKVENGAAFAITQPVFDQDALLRFLDAVESELATSSEIEPIPILAGIWPLASYRNAIFMHNEVPGVVVPDAIMQRMEKASQFSKEDQMKVGIEIARESLFRIQDRISGVQISAPFGRVEIALAVLE